MKSNVLKLDPGYFRPRKKGKKFTNDIPAVNKNVGIRVLVAQPT
jgi:hypothetical protein